MKGIRTLLLSLLLILLGSGALADHIVCTDFPCYDILRAVVGNDEEVSLLIRPGTEVHSYDPTPSDILRVGSADLFVFIGGESDAWVDSILAGFGSDSPATLRMIDHVSPLEEVGDHGHSHEEEEEEAPELDEHIWTSPKNELAMVRAAESALCAVYPDRADSFHANADAYCTAIESLDAELTVLLATAARRMIVVADRFPFLYLAHDYGLEYKAAFASCTSDTEPSARVMVQLIDTIVQNDIPVVYTIELSNQKIAQTLSEETGAAILQLHSMQTVTQREFEAGETYLTLMQRNIEALREGLT